MAPDQKPAAKPDADLTGADPDKVVGGTSLGLNSLIKQAGTGGKQRQYGYDYGHATMPTGGYFYSCHPRPRPIITVQW